MTTPVSFRCFRVAIWFFLQNFQLILIPYFFETKKVCSTASTQYWIWTIGADPLANMFWKPWKHENQTAGYITKFDLGENATSSFIFVTVHGAGHEVPAYRPSEALAMFSSYFTGQWEIEDITF